MENLAAQTLHMKRCDPSRNMARFYAMTLQPTLFGEVSLIRNWGRIGGQGQVLSETFARPNEADAAFAKLERTKRRRGYH